MLALRPQRPGQTQSVVLLFLPLSRTMFFIFAFLYLARQYGTGAVPIESSFAEPLVYDAPTFTRDECPACLCPGRSVWDIVWSCLATTFAVTWVSVHPNVPRLEEKSWPLLKRRIFLMCLALLAPEVMIMWAFKQWRGALMIRETINKGRQESCVQWTMTHAHFLQMGGFKVNSIEGGCVYCSKYYYETKKKGIVVRESVLRFDDLRELLEKQLIDFPDTTAKEIEDRSKGDALSKGVALLQISWFIIQLIARAHQHLTITEIELTTAALAGLNSIMYLFWWNKPLDVRCPIVIKTKSLEMALAGKAMKARDGENESQNEGGSGRDTSAETWSFPGKKFRLRDYLRNSAQSIFSALATQLRSLPKWLLKTIRALRRLIPRRLGNVVEPEIELQISTCGPKDSSATRSHFHRAVIWIWTTCTVVVTKLFYLPYLLMFLPMDNILGLVRDVDLEGYSDAKDKMHSKPALEMLFDERDMVWIMGMMFYSEKAETMPLLIFAALAGAGFGSIHCAAWHFDFPSPVEQILWRTASLSLVGVCLSLIAGIPLYSAIDRQYQRIPFPEDFYWRVSRRTLQTTPAIIYPIARLSLLVLALLSLRRLPPSAFDTVVWTIFIPHI